jgi:hypothetical protein
MSLCGEEKMSKERTLVDIIEYLIGEIVEVQDKIHQELLQLTYALEPQELKQIYKALMKLTEAQFRLLLVKNNILKQQKHE